MPTGKNWLYFFYVNLGFIVFIISIYYFIFSHDIKQNWSQYRCNPMYMPLSDDIEKDFVYCIQTMQSNYMGYLLQPITYVLASLTDMGSEFSTSMNDTRNMFQKIRNFTVLIVQSIFGVFLNLIIEFQKITIGIRDLVGKMVGIVVSILYIMDGSNKTIQSMWNGPSGQLVRKIGKCFHPETKIKLQDGSVVNMKDINPGDKLEDGSCVVAIMKIDNKDRANYQPFYVLTERGVNGESIYVTGSHHIFDKVLNKFIKVKEHNEAELTGDKSTEWFSCLITDTHRIKIGEEIFWDWEDYLLH